jgi:hypothetical protein
MLPLQVKYDDVHTKEFVVNNRKIKCVYDLGYCNYIQNPNLKTIDNGYYTYIIHDNNQLKIASVAPFENGSKHIQLIQGTGISWIGGEFLKNENEIVYNLQAGLFRNINPYNEKHHTDEMIQMIHKTFKKCNTCSMRFTNHPLINDQDFIKKGLWNLTNINQMYYHL